MRRFRVALEGPTCTTAGKQWFLSMLVACVRRVFGAPDADAKGVGIDKNHCVIHLHSGRAAQILLSAALRALKARA
jgi:hypothetical protein